MDDVVAAIEKAAQLVGSESMLASSLGLVRSNVSYWKRVKEVPAEHCPDIERLTGRVVRCEQLNKRVDWSYVRNAV